MTERLFLQERLDQILVVLQEQGRVSVAGLGDRFDVSAATIRNDLATLEKQGHLMRTRGGAVPAAPASAEPPAFALRKRLHAQEKERIGRAAALMVQDGDAIALDASTTAWHMARCIKDRRELTVVTNGLFIALEFVDSPGVSVVMPGGSLRTASVSLVGDLGANILDNFYVQKGFFSGGGFALEEGLTDTNQYEVELKQRMLQRSKEVIALVDSSKWGTVTFAPLAAIQDMDRVIADNGAPAKMVEALRQRGVEVLLV